MRCKIFKFLENVTNGNKTQQNFNIYEPTNILIVWTFQSKVLRQLADAPFYGE